MVLFRFVLCAPFPQSSQRTQATAAAGEQEITDRRRTRRDEAIPDLEIDGEVVSVEPPFKVPCAHACNTPMRAFDFECLPPSRKCRLRLGVI